MNIQTRKSWGARAPRSRTLQSDSIIRELFLHYPADGHDLSHIDIDQEQDSYMRGIQNFHMDVRGWADFAYSFAVFQDGRVYRGRGRDVVPAAQLGHNTGTNAVLCVVGNTEDPTRAMYLSLAELKDYLDKQIGRDLLVRPHSSVTATGCPGNGVRSIISRLNARH